MAQAQTQAPSALALTGSLTLTAASASSLPDVRFMGKMSPVVTLEWSGNKHSSPPCKSGGVQPRWNHLWPVLDLSSSSATSVVSFEVTDKSTLVASTSLPLGDLIRRIIEQAKDSAGLQTIKMTLQSPKGKWAGELSIIGVWTPAMSVAQQPQPMQLVQPVPPLMQQPSMQLMQSPPPQAMYQPQPPQLMHQASYLPPQQGYYPPPSTVQPMVVSPQGGYPPQPVAYAPMQPVMAPVAQSFAPPPAAPYGYAQPQQQLAYYPVQQAVPAPVPSAWSPVASADDGVFPYSELTITRLIGEGTFGTVSAGEFRSTPVAVKQLKQSTFTQAQWADFMNEVKFLREARHPNLVLFMGVTLQPYSIVTELLDTSLFDILYQKRVQLTPHQKVHIALSVARGLASLHGRPIPIVHRDIKSLNILVSKDLVNVKICDLGMVKLKAAYGTRLESNGTPNWMSPECLMDQPYDEQTDVFSFGCVLYEITTSTVPFAGVFKEELVRRVGQSSERPPLPPNLEPYWRDLLIKCWQQHPRSRPTMKEVVAQLAAIRI